MIGWGSYINPWHPGEDKFPSPGQKSFHISKTPTTRGRKRTLPGSIPRRRMWKPQPNWLAANWLRLMDPARGKSCPSCQRRGPAAPGEDDFPSPVQKPVHKFTTPTTRGRKRRSPGSIPPRRMWKRQLHRVIADWLGLIEPARSESCPSGQRRGPAAPGEDNFPSPGEKPSISLQIQQPGDENTDTLGRYRPAGCGNANPTG